MKPIALLAACALCAASHAQVQLTPVKPTVNLPPGQAVPPVSKDVPALTAAQSEVDFGYIHVDGSAERFVLLTNTGETPLTIRDVATPCDCMIADVWPREIGPGESAELSMRFEADGRIRPFRQAIRVITAEHSVPLTVTAVGETGWAVRTWLVGSDGSAVFRVSVPSGDIALKSTTETPFRVLTMNGFDLGMSEWSEEQLQDRYVLQFDWSRTEDETRPRYLVLETDHEDAEMILLPVNIEGTTPSPASPMSFRPEMVPLSLTPLRAGDVREIEYTLRRTPAEPGVERLGVECDIPGLEAELLSAERNPDNGKTTGRLRLRVTDEVEPGFHAGLLTFRLGEHFTTLDTFARVRE